MKLSGWNQYWEHKENISLSPEVVYRKLCTYYKQSSKSFSLKSENSPSTFSFQRGNALFSVLGIGSELWCKHFIDISVIEIEEGVTQVEWKINLKLFGLQSGKNAIIEECKNVIKSIA
ncbi:MAG: hypothetical protein KAG26_03275 [Methylococcales bacterium]|nr:hypothetical protein [Methylococcales bacterium]